MRTLRGIPADYLKIGLQLLYDAVFVSGIRCSGPAILLHLGSDFFDTLMSAHLVLTSAPWGKEVTLSPPFFI